MVARLSDRTETTVSDEVIDRRLEFLWQRVLKAQIHAGLESYNGALIAYYQSAERYGRQAPSIRQYSERLSRGE